MRSKIRYIVDKRKTIIGIILSPIILYVLNILATCVFNLGTYLGTFLRNLYFIVVNL